MSVTPEIDEPQGYIPEPPNPPSPPYLRHRVTRVAIDYHLVLDVEINLNPQKIARLLWKIKNDHNVVFYICSFSGKKTGEKTAFVLQNEGEIRGIFHSLQQKDIIVHDKTGKGGKVSWCRARDISFLVDDNESVIKECNESGGEVLGFPIRSPKTSHPRSFESYGCLTEALIVLEGILKRKELARNEARKTPCYAGQNSPNGAWEFAIREDEREGTVQELLTKNSQPPQASQGPSQSRQDQGWQKQRTRCRRDR